MRSWGLLGAVSSLVLTAHAAAASPQARLVYSRGVGAENCADEAALRRAVAARIGYDPFFPWASKTVVAIISARGDRMVARVELVGDEARSEGSRDLVSETADCASLLDTMALTISIAIDPHALAGAAPPSPPAPDPAPVPHAVPTPTPTPATLSSRDADADASNDGTPIEITRRPPIALTAEGRVSFGTQPSPSPGLAVGGLVAWERFSVGLEGSVSTPTDTDARGGGRVRAWLAAASVVPCLRFGPGRACGLVSAGRFEGSAIGVTSPETRANALFAFGARAGVEIPIAASFVAVAHADLLVNASPATLRVGSEDVWTSPRLGGAMALGAGWYY